MEPDKRTDFQSGQTKRGWSPKRRARIMAARGGVGSLSMG